MDIKAAGLRFVSHKTTKDPLCFEALVYELIVDSAEDLAAGTVVVADKINTALGVPERPFHYFFLRRGASFGVLNRNFACRSTGKFLNFTSVVPYPSFLGRLRSYHIKILILI
ncbi:hypothetical protein NPIL_480421 [Nephila pilipes]|uniref:Uncharacterized protein n=1 Tax=Nephila pilipes TaxID=299642 RepID=A0A8X6U3P2_NEPPI|nr:hypothetical protein NPIL_480421 [Nephila pilipes]